MRYWIFLSTGLIFKKEIQLMPYLYKNIGVLVRISSKLLIHTKNFISPCLNVLDSYTFLKVIIKILNRIFSQGNKYLFILILKKVLNLAHDQIHF